MIHIQFPRAWHTINVKKIRQLSFIQQHLANTVSVLFTVPRAEAEDVVLKIFPPGGGSGRCTSKLGPPTPNLQALRRATPAIQS